MRVYNPEGNIGFVASNLRWLRVFIYLFLCAIFSSVSAAADREFQIVTEDLPPYSYRDDGRITGLCTEIVREILKELDHPDNIQMLTWSRAYNLTLNESGYLLYSTIRTENREASFKWAGPLVNDKTVFIGRKGRGISIKSLEDAMKVGAIGVYKDDFAESLLKEKGFSNLQSVMDDRLNLKKLLSDRIDLWVASKLVSLHMVREANSSDRIEVLYLLREDPFYLAFSKDTPDEEVARWQRALDDLKKSEAYSSILRKYGFED